MRDIMKYENEINQTHLLWKRIANSPEVFFTISM